MCVRYLYASFVLTTSGIPTQPIEITQGLPGICSSEYTSKKLLFHLCFFCGVTCQAEYVFLTKASIIIGRFKFGKLSEHILSGMVDNAMFM